MSRVGSATNNARTSQFQEPVGGTAFCAFVSAVERITSLETKIRAVDKPIHAAIMLAWEQATATWPS